MKQFKRSSTDEMIYYVVHPYNWWIHPYHCGSVVKNPPRDMTSTLWSRKFPHVAEQLSLCVTTIASVL